MVEQNWRFFNGVDLAVDKGIDPVPGVGERKWTGDIFESLHLSNNNMDRYYSLY